MIQVTCDNCGKQFNIADKFAGRVGKCSGCGQPMQIPELEPAEPQEPGVEEIIDDDLADEELLDEPAPAQEADEEVTEAPTIDEEVPDSGAKRKKMIIAVSAAVAVVVVVLAIVLTLTSKDKPPEAPAPQPVPADAQGESTEPADAEGATGQPATEPEKAPTLVSDECVPASAPAIVENVEIRITWAKVAPVMIEDRATNRTKKSDRAVLAVQVQITNRDKRKILEYETWAGKSGSFERDFGTIEDNLGNGYKRITYGRGVPVGRVVKGMVAPNRSITDVLLFHRPADRFEYLELALPAENIGGSGTICFRIPASMIER